MTTGADPRVSAFSAKGIYDRFSGVKEGYNKKPKQPKQQKTIPQAQVSKNQKQAQQKKLNQIKNANSVNNVKKQNKAPASLKETESIYSYTTSVKSNTPYHPLPMDMYPQSMYSYSTHQSRRGENYVSVPMNKFGYFADSFPQQPKVQKQPKQQKEQKEQKASKPKEKQPVKKEPVAEKSKDYGKQFYTSWLATKQFMQDWAVTKPKLAATPAPAAKQRQLPTQKPQAEKGGPPPAGASLSSNDQANLIPIPITGMALNKYPPSTYSMRTGPDELHYDAYSVMDPMVPVQMPVPGMVVADPLVQPMAMMPVPVAGTQPSSSSHSSEHKSKISSLTSKKRSPTVSLKNSIVNSSHGETISSGQQHEQMPSASMSFRSAHTQIPAPYSASVHTMQPGLKQPSIVARTAVPSVRSHRPMPVTGKFSKQRFAESLRTFLDVFRSFARMSFILKPIDAIADAVPKLEITVVILELLMLMWLLYEVMILVEFLAAFTKQICKPAIILGSYLGLGFKQKVSH